MLKKSLPIVLVLGLLMLAFPLWTAAQDGQPPDAPLSGNAWRGARGGRMHGGGLNPVEATAQVTGLTPVEVVAALQAGQTFADVAVTAGFTAQDIVDVVIEARAEMLAQAVTDGRLTQAEADAKLVEMETTLVEHMSAPWEPRGAGNGLRPQDGTGMGQRGGMRGRGQMGGGCSATCNCGDVQP